LELRGKSLHQESSDDLGGDFDILVRLNLLLQRVDSVEVVRQRHAILLLRADQFIDGVEELVGLVILVSGLDGLHHLLRSGLPIDDRVLVRFNTHSDAALGHFHPRVPLAFGLHLLRFLFCPGDNFPKIAGFQEGFYLKTPTLIVGAIELDYRYGLFSVHCGPIPCWKLEL